MSGFEKDLSIGATKKQSQFSQGGFSHMFGKLIIMMALLSFKTAPLVFYFYANCFTSSFIVQFLITITLLSMDFWMIKNIRLLIGLQWWNFVDDDGNNHWKFETTEDMTQFPAIDRRVFWIGLVVGPAAWTFFVITAFLSFKFEWMIVALLGALMNLAHLWRYLSCHWNHTENTEQMTSDVQIPTTSHEACKLKLKTTMLQDRRMMFACIKYDVLQENPVEYAFNNFCRAFGDEMIKYTDFDFWFHRIRDGHFDLNHDRRTDPVLSELSKMPRELSEKIFGYLEWKDRCAVRKVSRKLRSAVDSSKQSFNKVSFKTTEFGCCLQVEDKNYSRQVNYDRLNPDIRISLNYEQDTIINEMTCWEAALSDLICILKCPRVEIKELDIYYDDQQTVEVVHGVLKGALSTRKHKLSVKSYNTTVDSPNEALAVIPYLKSGMLKTIRIQQRRLETRLNIDDLSEFEQWKKASVDTGLIVCSKVDKLFNLTCFAADIPTITTEDFLRLKEVLHASPSFERGFVIPADLVSAENVRIGLGMEHKTIEDRFETLFLDVQNCILFKKTNNYERW